MRTTGDRTLDVLLCDGIVALRDGTVALRDGTVAHIRPVRPDDEAGLQAFLRGLGSRSRRLRFFSAGTGLFLAEAAHAQAAADGVREFGLVATAGGAETIVAHGHYVLAGADRAEIAFAVADAYQGRGLGTLLLGRLAEAAAARGIHVFEATVLPENDAMIEVLRGSGFPVEMRRVQGEIQVTLATTPSDAPRRRLEDREPAARSGGS
jgi:RimJ/RimL family protein N-acetyltransferase